MNVQKERNKKTMITLVSSSMENVGVEMSAMIDTVRLVTVT